VILDWLEALPLAAWLRRSTIAYPLVNAAHILGIGLILGAILPLDLRLMGVFRAAPLPVIGPFLSRAAAVGVALALVTGALLFLVKPAEYLANPAFLAKLGLLALALANVALIHLGAGWRQAVTGRGVAPALRLSAAASMLLWLGALVAGRWIGFL
jgi:hypothetical protein